MRELLLCTIVSRLLTMFPPTETTVAVLKFLSSLYSYIFLKLYLGCLETTYTCKNERSFSFWRPFFSNIFCIHAPFLSFFSYSVVDNRAVIRSL